MARILLIQAGPTPWEMEDRLVGNHPLPLTDLAKATIEGIVRNLPHAVSAVYRFKKNEACDQASQIVANILKLKPNDSAVLDEWNLGLWQGLTRNELNFRFPTVFAQWEDDPLAVNPPEGETFLEAIERLDGAIKRILKRNRSGAMIFLLRPMAMQIVLGLLRREEPGLIASHLHNSAAIETIEIPGDQVRQFVM